MVGAARFELATPWSQTRCATRLRHAPTVLGIQGNDGGFKLAKKRKGSARLIDRVKQPEDSAGSKHKIRLRHVDSFADSAARFDKSHARCRANQPARALQPVASACRAQKFGVEFHRHRAAFQIAKYGRCRQPVGQRTQKPAMTNIAAVAMAPLQSHALPEGFTIGTVIPRAIMCGEWPTPHA